MTINQITSVESFFFVLLNLTPSKPVETGGDWWVEEADSELHEGRKRFLESQGFESRAEGFRMFSPRISGCQENKKNTQRQSNFVWGGRIFFKCFNGFNFVGWCFLTNFQGAERWFSTRICWFSARIELETKHWEPSWRFRCFIDLSHIFGVTTFSCRGVFFAQWSICQNERQLRWVYWDSKRNAPTKSFSKSSGWFSMFERCWHVSFNNFENV